MGNFEQNLKLVKTAVKKFTNCIGNVQELFLIFELVRINNYNYYEFL